MNQYLSVENEIAEAVESNLPVVALESTILSHGMPYPENLEFARRVEAVVRGNGAVPATTAILDGKLKVGLDDSELELMCRGEAVGKVSRRDASVYLSTRKPGATTVATTMMIAEMAGIRVFSTGGIGGVHRGGENTMDISADLEELAVTSVAVVCAGAKAILDIGLTLEYLETKGVPVIGYMTDEFPAFYTRRSGFQVDYAAEGAREVAEILRAKWSLGLKGGVIIANPIPEEYSMNSDEIEKSIKAAVSEAESRGIRGKGLTPFLLSEIKRLTGGDSFASNLQLAYNNARVASAIAREYAALQEPL